MNPENSTRQGQPGFFDHLEVLRWKIISILIVLLAGFVVSFIFIDKIVYFLQYPVLKYNVPLAYFKPYEKFLAYIKIAFFGGVTIAFPFAVYQIGSFIYPALKKEEKTVFYAVLLAIPLIFIAGAYFAYSMIIPLAFRFFITFGSGDRIVPLWSIGEYFSLLTSFLLICGLVFEYPLILLFLIKIKILSVSTLVRFRSYIIVIIAVTAAVISPPDVLSMVMIGVPLYLLFELTIIIGRFIK
jgi:sec-independent protein translocase protein TatC